MYTVIGMNSICNPNLKHKGVQFLEVSRVYKHLRFTPVPLTNPKITFEVFKIWKQKTIFVVKSQMTQFFEDSLLYIIHYTLYIIHYTLYIIHYTLYIIHYTLYIIHYTLYLKVNPNVYFHL